MDAARRANRAVTVAVEPVTTPGWCAALWPAAGLAIEEDRRDDLPRADLDTGRELAAWVGIVGEPEVIFIRDPVPTPTP